MTAPPEVRGQPARDRGDQPAALLADTARFVELAAPAKQLDPGALFAVDPGVDQLARLPLPGGGAAMLDDDIKGIGRQQSVLQIDLLAEHLKIGLDCARRRPRRAGRAVQAGTNGAAYAQRRLVDCDGRAGEL